MPRAALYSDGGDVYSNIMVLPPCPLRLKRSFVWKYQLGGIALLLVGVAAAIGYAWWQYDNMVELVEQSKIWRGGVVAPSCAAGGKVTTHKFFFHEYKLDVKYMDAARKAHAGKLSFDTVTEINRDSEPEVRYLEENPEKFALSWAVDVTTGRWLNIVFFAIVGVGLVGGSFSYLGYTALRRLAHARSCARRAEELLVRVTKIEPQMVKGKHTGNEYHYAGQTFDGRPVTGKIVFTVKDEPLFVDAEKQHLLALVSSDDLKRSTVLRRDFYPFDLNEAEQAAAREALVRLSAVR
ncbi:MAG TPA: hypothetical protein VFJ90_12605 [Candidatus Didemnitutus sp.]|nr:hypothetical protein [Candidatus Didemnitutus sp.]